MENKNDSVKCRVRAHSSSGKITKAYSIKYSIKLPNNQYLVSVSPATVQSDDF